MLSTNQIAPFRPGFLEAVVYGALCAGVCLMGPGTGNSLSLRQVQIALRNGTEGKGLHLLRYVRDGKRYRLIG